MTPPRLTLKLLFGLAVIAFVVTVGAVFNAEHFSHLDTELINTAGRQRFLSQRIALSAARLATEPNPPTRRDLRAALTADADTLSRIQAGFVELYETDPDLDQSVREYAAIANAIAEVPDGELTTHHPDLGSLVTASGEVLTGLDAFVNETQLDFEFHIARLQLSGILALGATLVSLFGLGFFIFLPMARRIRHDSEALEALAHSKDELIASVSHELRTPLTAILGFAEVLRTDSDDLALSERKELLELIVRESEEVAGIIEDLLAAARAEIGQLTVVRVEVNLRAQVAQVLESRVGQPGLSIEVSADPVLAWGDPARVRQIIRNLISNAARHGGDYCRVQISASHSLARLTVRDDGPGVPDADTEAIFDPYHTVTSEETQPGSVGLGLTLSRRLARLMGGDLTYQREDKHTIFELTLPLAETAKTASGATTATKTATRPS